MLTVNTEQLERLQNRLGGLQLKFAQRNTINGQAFATQKIARGTIKREMVNRNTWTQKSVRVDPARSLRDSAMVGSVERYMADQEFGHVDTQHTAMATPAASGEAPRAKLRRRPVRRANRMSAISLGKRVRAGGSKAQQNIIALREAKEDGRKFVYIDRGRVKGIYKVMGTKLAPKSRMVQNLSRRVAIVPRNPWLRPSTVSPQQSRDIFFDNMRRQLRRATR